MMPVNLKKKKQKGALQLRIQGCAIKAFYKPWPCLRQMTEIILKLVFVLIFVP